MTNKLNVKSRALCFNNGLAINSLQWQYNDSDGLLLFLFLNVAVGPLGSPLQEELSIASFFAVLF
jgi:hypothetical protein